MPVWVPGRGELIWLRFTPQAGRRPALVLSPAGYNRRTGLMLCCPITSQVKGYPFEVPLPEASPIEGVILADQVRNLDWKARAAKLIGKVEGALVADVTNRILRLLQD